MSADNLAPTMAMALLTNGTVVVSCELSHSNRNLVLNLRSSYVRVPLVPLRTPLPNRLD